MDSKTTAFRLIMDFLQLRLFLFFVYFFQFYPHFQVFSQALLVLCGVLQGKQNENPSPFNSKKHKFIMTGYTIRVIMTHVKAAATEMIGEQNQQQQRGWLWT